MDDNSASVQRVTVSENTSHGPIFFFITLLKYCTISVKKWITESAQLSTTCSQSVMNVQWDSFECSTMYIAGITKRSFRIFYVEFLILEEREQLYAHQ